ncbi:MAG: GTP-binding protein YchF [candidate division TM6 bacterium GW2011_GWF2_28_16]|nr:MAG: GTP-binding protein YchF [candidate division TM6 bacterium GW2011_GWF2_28_16]
MAIQAGLVGLPNVGKSTLFNALTKAGIPAENYPFCTIDPHMAITNVPDKRLEELAKIFGSQKLIPTTVQFCDIAGLVKGAATGEGLGNQFLSNIMGVDLIIHVLRCFEDKNVTHVHDHLDPIDDFEVIVSELMLKDLESIEKKEEKLNALLKSAKNKNFTPNQIKELEQELELVLKVKNFINSGNFYGVQDIIREYANKNIKTIDLLSAKNFIIIANISEDDLQNKNYLNNIHYKNLVAKFGANKVIAISAKIEAELSQLEDSEKQEMLASLEIDESGLDKIIKSTYQNLGLITFFTCGPKEAHAWSLRQNTKAPQAAGEIHSDLERGFICAVVYNYSDIMLAGSEAKLRDTGKMRTEGKDYIIKDGDIILIRFNV